jgi:hypothetical protein
VPGGTASGFSSSCMSRSLGLMIVTRAAALGPARALVSGQLVELVFEASPRLGAPSGVGSCSRPPSTSAPGRSRAARRRSRAAPPAGHGRGRPPRPRRLRREDAPGLLAQVRGQAGRREEEPAPRLFGQRRAARESRRPRGAARALRAGAVVERRAGGLGVGSRGSLMGSVLQTGRGRRGRAWRFPRPTGMKRRSRARVPKAPAASPPPCVRAAFGLCLRLRALRAQLGGGHAQSRGCGRGSDRRPRRI